MTGEGYDDGEKKANWLGRERKREKENTHEGKNSLPSRRPLGCKTLGAGGRRGTAARVRDRERLREREIFAWVAYVQGCKRRPFPLLL